MAVGAGYAGGGAAVGVPGLPWCRWLVAAQNSFDIIEVQTPCAPPTLHLNFVSGIDQAEADESWAFSDVRVVSRPDLESGLEPEMEPGGGH